MDNKNAEQQRERLTAQWFLVGAVIFAGIVFAIMFLRG